MVFHKIFILEALLLKNINTELIMGKNILGLDLGTNSIGWALVEQDFEKKEGEARALLPRKQFTKSNQHV
ncbi:MULTISPECIES: hypothetical protein [Chitinophagaceae]